MQHVCIGLYSRGAFYRIMPKFKGMNEISSHFCRPIPAFAPCIFAKTRKSNVCLKVKVCDRFIKYTIFVNRLKLEISFASFFHAQNYKEAGYFNHLLDLQLTLVVGICWSHAEFFYIRLAFL